MTFDPAFTSTSFTPDRLHAGSFPIATIQGTLTNNQSQGALTRGAVLGQHTDGTWGRVHQTGNYGAATARGILAKSADPSGGNVEVIIYATGEFNEDEVTLGGTVTLANVREVLAAYNVYLRAPVDA